MNEINLSDKIEVRCPKCKKLAIKHSRRKFTDGYRTQYLCINSSCEKQKFTIAKRQDMRLCKVEGCTAKSKARNLCKKHYNKQYYRNKRNVI